MAGETDLKAILKSLSPLLLEPTYVFCTVPNARHSHHT